MPQLEQVLKIDPPTELRFRGPFVSQVTSYLKIFNPTDKKVLFKIKTTAPKKYCVRPNSGVLEPNKGVEVAVSLQPFEYDPAEKNKHKFMVLSTIAPDGEWNFDSIWANLKPDESMDSKLKCVFEMPVDDEEAVNEEPLASEDVRKRLPEKASVKKEYYNEPAPELVKDIKLLRMEESSLRQKNLELQEELARLNKTLAAQPEAQYKVNTQSAAQYKANTTLSTAMPVEPQGRQMMDFVIAFFIALIGMVLGKFFL